MEHCKIFKTWNGPKILIRCHLPTASSSIKVLITACIRFERGYMELYTPLSGEPAKPVILSTKEQTENTVKKVEKKKLPKPQKVGKGNIYSVYKRFISLRNKERKKASLEYFYCGGGGGGCIVYDGTAFLVV